MGALFNAVLVALDDMKQKYGATAAPIVCWYLPKYGSGENVWDTYFELVGFNGHTDVNAEYRGEYDPNRMDYRTALHDVYAAHVRVKSIITDKCDQIFAGVPTNSHIIGVHLRNTDRNLEPWFASPGREYVCKRLKDEIMLCSPDVVVYVYIASDNIPDADFIKSELSTFERRTFVLEDPDAVRSPNHTSVHGTHDRGLQGVPNDKKARSILTDIFCLSRCDVLVRTCSNVTAAAGIINPHAKIVDVSKEMGRKTELWLSA